MKAKQLIEQLKEFPPEEEIYLASDEEGNEVFAVHEMVVLEREEGDLAVIYPKGEPLD